ncbi:hypothetical protein CFY87_05155 [Actinobacillus seminis]|uniref:Predicted membrane protein n=1 Tax=Actinobacillus seminis TaxID=722 RepID=A0A263HDD4_9PAST|nr:DUF4870 domain-containing protein [Actinobacillus seminis]OZN25101.1 hypothetical protein CFY87_05155 [Actinobacillus seminis]SUU33784.1 Predicted membrane protein [Actinobacillus seminis]
MSEQSVIEVKDPHKTIVLITYGLFFIGLFIGGLPTLIGVIIAYMKRKETEGTVYHGYLNYLIKTFWIGFLGILLGIILSIVGIGMLVIMATGLLYLIRLVYSFLKVLDKKPVNPASWLI